MRLAKGDAIKNILILLVSAVFLIYMTLVSGCNDGGKAVTRSNEDGSAFESVIDNGVGVDTGGADVQKIVVDSGFGNDGGDSILRLRKGYVIAAAYNNVSDRDIMLLRLKRDGTLKTTFGNQTPTDGTSIFSGGVTGGNDRFNTLLKIKTGYIIIGRRDNGVDDDIWMLKVKKDGTLATKFGNQTPTDGTSIFAGITGGNDRVNAVLKIKTGYILIGRRDNGVDDDIWMLKVKKDGTLATKFGNQTPTDGTSIFAGITGGNDNATLIKKVKGGYLIGGTRDNGLDDDIWVLKVKKNGTLATKFGNQAPTDGTSIFAGGVSGGNDDITSIIKVKGGYILTGLRDNGLDDDIWMLKMKTNGTLKTTFGNQTPTDGTSIFSGGVSGGNDDISTVIRIRTGYILVGLRDNGTDDDIWMLKVKKDGTLATKFGNQTPTDGTSIFAGGVSGGNDDISTVIRIRTGYILVGIRDNGTDDDIWMLKVKKNGTLATKFGNQTPTDGTSIFDRGFGNDAPCVAQKAIGGGYIISGSTSNGTDDDVYVIKTTKKGILRP